MVKRQFKMVTGLTGLLVATGVGGLLNDQGDGWVGLAYAQNAESWDEEADNGEADESSSEEAGDDESVEQSEPVEETEAAENSESPASDEEASAEPTNEPGAEEPADPGPAPAAAQAESQPQDAPPSKPVSGQDRVREVLIASIKEIVPGLDEHAFADSDRLVDLGANSVDRAEITMLAQERLGLNIPRTELFGPKNLGEMIALLASKMP